MTCVDKSSGGCPPPVSSIHEADVFGTEPVEREGLDESGQLYALPGDSEAVSQPESEPERHPMRVVIHGVDVMALEGSPYSLYAGGSASVRAMPGGLHNMVEAHAGIRARLGDDEVSLTSSPGVRLEQELRYPSAEHLGLTSLGITPAFEFKVRGDLVGEESARFAFRLDAYFGGTLFEPLDRSEMETGTKRLASASLKLGITEQLHAYAAGSLESYESRDTAYLAGMKPSAVRDFGQSYKAVEAGLGWRNGVWSVEAGVVAADVSTSTRGPVKPRLNIDIAAARAAVEYKFGNSPFKLALDATFTFSSDHPPADEPVGIQPASLKLHHPTGRLKLSADF